MADTKISALTALTGANIATDDEIVLVDTSVTTTKKMTVAELRTALGGDILTFNTGGVGIAGSITTYMNSGVSSTAVTDVDTPIPFACTVKNLYVKAAGAAAGTRTYTLMKNAVATALTCASTGATTTANDTSNSVTFATGDTISLRLVTSGDATSSPHNASVHVLRTS